MVLWRLSFSSSGRNAVAKAAEISAVEKQKFRGLLISIEFGIRGPNRRFATGCIGQLECSLFDHLNRFFADKEKSVLFGK